MNTNLITFDRANLIITVNLSKGDLVIKKDDVQISYFSGGPGGQNVNRNMSGVRIIYHIPDEHRKPFAKTREIVTRSINQRKKEQNLIQAFGQLAQKLNRYFYVKPTRKKTKTPRRAKEKRLKGKKMKSLKKQSRQKVSGEV